MSHHAPESDSTSNPQHANAAKVQEIRNRFQNSKPDLEQLIKSSDAAFVTTMGEYWPWLQMVAKLKKLRNESGIDVQSIATKCGVGVDAIEQIEAGDMGQSSLSVLSNYAAAVGQRLVVDLAKAS